MLNVFHGNIRTTPVYIYKVVHIYLVTYIICYIFVIGSTHKQFRLYVLKRGQVL